MKLIFRYLKKYTWVLIAAIALLFVQAVSDLALPSMMSSIVNTGIQQGGIEQTAPQVLSANALKLMETFAGDDANTIKTAYEKTDDMSGRFAKAAGAYAKTAPSEKLDAAYNDAAYTALIAMRSMMKGASTDSGSFDMDNFDITKIYPFVDKMAASADITAARAEAAKVDSLTKAQLGTSFTALFYKELGVDTDGLRMDYIIRIGLEMLGVALVGIAAAVFVGLISSKVAANVGRRLRRDTFGKVIGFSENEFDRFSTASLITRTTNDITQVQMFVLIGIRLLPFAPIMAAGGIVMALSKSVSLSWIIVVAVIAVIGVLGAIMVVAVPRFKLLQKLTDKLNLVSRENLLGMMVIRAFGNEDKEEKRFAAANDDLANMNKFLFRIMSVIMPAMMIIMNVVSVVVVWVGASQIAASSLQIGDMMAFMQYAIQIIMSFMFIAMMFVMLPRASVSAARVGEVLSSETEIKEKAEPVHMGRANGVVEFDNVTFEYGGSNLPVIENISFTARSGETTAIIGATGSGKSTLINLIPRLYDVSSGAVRIDGTDVRDLDIRELRANIGYVSQKGVLFSGTVASNVAYGAEGATDEDIMRAIKTAQAEEFVKDKSGGIEGAISQGGSNVSGGQKQRLSIARAIAKKAPIYIFDDSFSALDFKTDAALRRALKTDTDKSTVIIVAQRISTVMSAEQIIVLDNGRIAGKGTHRELIRSCAAYREIAESQLGKEAVEGGMA